MNIEKRLINLGWECVSERYFHKGNAILVHYLNDSARRTIQKSHWRLYSDFDANEYKVYMTTTELFAELEKEET